MERTTVIWPPTHRPNVTAGLRWPPEILKPTEIMTATTSACAIATKNCPTTAFPFIWADYTIKVTSAPIFWTNILKWMKNIHRILHSWVRYQKPWKILHQQTQKETCKQIPLQVLWCCPAVAPLYSCRLMPLPLLHSCNYVYVRS